MTKARTAKEGVFAAPAVAVSLLPKVICPICSPAYAALLSSIGLGFLGSTAYLLPVTVVLLALAVGSLLFRASSRRGLGPFGIGLVAVACVLVGKFWLDSTAAGYVGVGMLIIASIWNAVPKRTAPNFCPECLPAEDGSRTEGT